MRLSGIENNGVMTTPTARLAELNLTLPPVAAPIAAYVPAVRTGSLVFTSGQLPTVNGELPLTGKVGKDVTAEQAAELARLCALNGLAAIDALVGLNNVVRIVKVVGFVACDPSLTNHSVVVNGASQLLGDVFGEAGVHARSSVGMACLPLDAPVEIELVVEVAD